MIPLRSFSEQTERLIWTASETRVFLRDPLFLRGESVGENEELVGWAWYRHRASAQSWAVLVCFCVHWSNGFCYLIASMGLQVIWSLGVAGLDIYALKIRRNLQNPVLVRLFVVGDWVTATLSLAAACSSAGVTILYIRDSDYCRSQPYLHCHRYQISIALGFMTWFLISISSLVMLWLLASI